MVKTNAMRLLDRAKIPYETFAYSSAITEGVLVAAALGEEVGQVFKTLVTVSGNGAHFVFVIPVAETLDLKAAARAVGVKSVSMLKQKDLLPLTGYIHGGCSPVGMKKQFGTVLDKSAESLDSFYVSGGRVGCQIKLSPRMLADYLSADFSDITVRE